MLTRLATILTAPALILVGCAGGVADGRVASETNVGEPPTEQTSGAETTPALQRLNRHAYEFYVNGLLSEELGDYRSALNFYNRALVYFPDSYEIGYSMADLYYRLREPELALEALSKIVPRDAGVFRLSAACFQLLNDEDGYRGAYLNVVRLDPDNDEAYSRLGHAYMNLHKLDSAVWAYDNLARVRSDDYRVWAQLGRLYLEIDVLDKSQHAYYQSVTLNNSLANLMSIVSLGDLYEAAGHYDSATASYERALGLDPTNTILLNLMVARASQREEFAFAAPLARRLTNLMPEDFAQARRLGMIYFYMDSLSLADSVFNSVVSRGDRHDLNHHFLGMIATERGEYERARDQFLIMSQLDDTSVVTWLNLGLAYRNLEQPEKEVEAYQTGLNRVPDEGDRRIRLMFALGATYERNQRYDEAVTVFEELLEIDPDYHQVLNYLGYMLADRGEQLDYALQLIARAVELQPNNTAYLDSYGWVYYRLGDYDKALFYLKKAVELDSDPVMFDHLGDAFDAKGESDLARKWWRKALELEPDNVAIMEKLNR